MDVTSKAINDGFSRTMEAPLCLVLVAGAFVVVGLVREVVPSKNYSMLMCNHFYLFVKDEDK
jgi:hypothetical protein